MAKKKDFAAGIDTGRLFTDIEQATGKTRQQGKANPQEAAQREQDMTTQGRKGCKLPRVNMAFSTDNYNFIKVMAKATGRNMTEFINDLVTAYRNEHPEFMDKAQGFLDFVNSGAFSTHRTGEE